MTRTRTLFSVFAALFVISLSAHAQTNITGTYIGELFVTMDESTLSDVSIYLIQEEGSNTYALSIKDFVFGELPIGDLDVTGISAEENDGIITLTKDGYSDGPTVDVPNISIPVSTRIYLQEATITNDQLTFVLTVNGMIGQEIPLTNVSFTGEKDTRTGIFSAKADKALAIFPSLVEDVIRIQGLTNGRYAIYNLSGSMQQSGITGKGEINVSALSTGLYLIAVDGKTAKFIKK
jgi:hypothetical protein